MSGGNPNATGKKARKAPELAARSRSILLKTLDILDKDGMPLHELLAEEAKENPIKIMDLVSKFIPKQIDGKLEHSGRVTLERTVKLLDGTIAEDD
ncbi:MAG: hypothetical protein DRI98_13260 [Bacteroidetes bacterium]|nr:MAG: hypothetical protein DRI98_13260 [Bacteroidota bacterium]